MLWEREADRTALIARGRLVMIFPVPVRKFDINHRFVECVAVALLVWLELRVRDSYLARCVEALRDGVGVKRLGVFASFPAFNSDCR